MRGIAKINGFKLKLIPTMILENPMAIHKDLETISVLGF
jgi:hypothetical protein